jgi:phage-related protein
MPTLPVKFSVFTTANKQTVVRVKRRTFGDGYVQTAPDGINPAKILWNISFVGLSNANANELEALIVSLNATTSQYLQWTAPDGEYGDWLLEGNINREYISTGIGLSSVSFTLAKYFSI